MNFHTAKKTLDVSCLPLWNPSRKETNNEISIVGAIVGIVGPGMPTWCVPVPVMPNLHQQICLQWWLPAASWSHGQKVPSGKLTVCELENGHRNGGFSHRKWWCFIVMLVYQRVSKGPKDFKPCFLFKTLHNMEQFEFWNYRIMIYHSKTILFKSMGSSFRMWSPHCKTKSTKSKHEASPFFPVASREKFASPDLKHAWLGNPN